MASVDLDGVAWLGLLAVPSRQVAIRHLTGLDRTRQQSSTLVQFAGDQFATSFRGESGGRTFAVTCSFFDGEHDDYLKLLNLLRQAQDAIDDRLVLRTYTGQVPGLDGAHIVTVSEDTQAPLDGGLTFQVSFTANAVAGSFEA